MPEHEFEIYLSLLSRLLRLSPAQKAAISDELRDHLEERLNGLIESGLSREQAIRAAIDEFGDLTGLALDLTKASRTPFRKVAVRSTVAASVVAALIVVGVSLFTPEHRLAAPPAVVAQQAEPVKNGSAEAPSPLVLLQDEELFPEFLRKQADIDVDERPLAEICQQLESIYQVPVRLRQSPLQDSGLNVSNPISLHLSGLTFEEVLNQLVGKLVGKLSTTVRVVWQVDGSLVQITTEDDARFFTRQFDLHELVKAGHAMRSLMEILQMSGGQWAETDGEGGTVAAVGDSVVVRQKYHVLRKIAQVLAVIAKPPAGSELVGNCSHREQLLKSLHQPSQIEVQNGPLSDVLQSLAKQQNVPLVIDEMALQEQGVDANGLVSLTLKNRPFGKLLDDLLDDRQLAYQIRNGVIQITTKEYAESDHSLMVYNVSELAASDQTLLQLMRAIFQTTSGRWEAEEGDGGSLARTDVGSVIFVKQTDRVQAQIHLLIEQLKRTWKGHLNGHDKATAGQPKSTIRTYRMSSEVATGISQTLPQLIDQEIWFAAGGDVPSVVVIPVTPRVEGQPAMSTLVIRQTPEAQRQVVKVLRNVGVQFVALPTDAAGTGGLYRGGLGGAVGGGMGGMGGGGMGGGVGGMGMGGMGGGMGGGGLF